MKAEFEVFTATPHELRTNSARTFENENVFSKGMEGGVRNKMAATQTKTMTCCAVGKDATVVQTHEVEVEVEGTECWVECIECKGKLEVNGHRTYLVPCGFLCKYCLEQVHTKCANCWSDEEDSDDESDDESEDESEDESKEKDVLEIRRQKQKEAQKRWYQANKEQVRERHRKWVEAHREEVREKAAARYQKEKAEKIDYPSEAEIRAALFGGKPRGRPRKTKEEEVKEKRGPGRPRKTAEEKAEVRRAAQRRYAKKHREQVLAAKKRHYEKHREEILQKEKDHYHANKEVYSEKAHAYYEAHKDHIKATTKAWYEAHKA
jgi:hypothetical protein